MFLFCDSLSILRSKEKRHDDSVDSKELFAVHLAVHGKNAERDGKKQRHDRLDINQLRELIPQLQLNPLLAAA